MIIFVGIGFIVIFDVIQKRGRFKRLNFHSKIAITTTLVLLVFGTLIYKLCNFNEFTWLESFFLSVTTRTAGFTTIDLANKLNHAMVIFTVFLMFVGASPASTGGGIKTITFFTLVTSVKCFALGEPQIHAFNRKISGQQILKAYILYTLEEIIFETVSAFGTVGLSLSVTPSLSAASKLILCLTMFVGRLGPVTFISFFNNRFTDTSVGSLRYVEGNVIIG